MAPVLLSRAEALAALGLPAGAAPSEAELRRLYHRLALEHHPDKVNCRGGDAAAATVRFQRISEAHALLTKCPPVPPAPTQPAPAPPPRPAPPASPSRPATPLLPRARRPSFASSGDGDSAPSAGSAGPSGDFCSFCHKTVLLVNATRALSLGIDIREYEAHPERLRTCLLCKMAQRSVLNEEKALDKLPQLRTRRGVFAELRQERRSFTVQGEAHYWLPDLEARARPAQAAPVHEAGFQTPEKPRRRPGGGDDESPGRSAGEPPSKRPRASETPLTPEAPEREASRAGTGPWWYRVTGDKKLGIRKRADVDAPASPAGHLAAGSAFCVSLRVLGPDGRLYLKLADGSGWTYDLSAKDVTKKVVEEISEAEAKAVGVVKVPKEKKAKKEKKEKGEAQ